MFSLPFRDNTRKEARRGPPLSKEESRPAVPMEREAEGDSRRKGKKANSFGGPERKKRQGCPLP